MEKMTVKRLKNITATVKDILSLKKRARDDDYILYGFYLNKHGLSVKTPFLTIYQLIQNKELPSMESVGRTRRKLQELYPELRGDSYIAHLRQENTKGYVEYSREKDL